MLSDKHPSRVAPHGPIQKSLGSGPGLPHPFNTREEQQPSSQGGTDLRWQISKNSHLRQVERIEAPHPHSANTRRTAGTRGPEGQLMGDWACRDRRYRPHQTTVCTTARWTDAQKPTRGGNVQAEATAPSGNLKRTGTFKH